MINPVMPFNRVTENRHCAYCLLNEEDIKTIAAAAIIFLDMDGVMILRGDHWIVNEIDKTLKQLFGHKEKYTELEDRTASAFHLFSDSVKALMDLVHRVEAQGKRVGIVISSSWSHDARTEDLLQMFHSQSFAPYIMGRTPSKWFFDPMQMKWDADLRLTDRGNEIQKWLDMHSEVKRYVSLDDERLVKGNQKVVELRKHWVPVSLNLFSHQETKIALEQLKVRAFHCHKCNIYPEEMAAQESNQVTLFIQDPIKHDLPHEDRVFSYLVQRFRNAGATVRVVATASHYSERNILNSIRELWLGRLRKNKPFHSEVDAWVAAHGSKYTLTIAAGQLAQCLQVEEASRLIWSTGYFKRISEDRHCEYCLYSNDELPGLKKISWIFLALGDVLSHITQREEAPKNFPDIASMHINQDAVDQFLQMIKKVQREVGIVLTPDHRLGYTTEEISSEIFINQPFGCYLKGRTPQLPSHDLGSEVDQWRHNHGLSNDTPYVVITTEALDRIPRMRTVIITNKSIKTEDMLKAADSLSF